MNWTPWHIATLVLLGLYVVFMLGAMFPSEGLSWRLRKVLLVSGTVFSAASIASMAIAWQS